MRPYQLATAAVLIGIAAVAMVDSRRGALIDPTGTAPGGIGSGFYPFWSAVLMAAGAAIVIWLTLRTPQPATGVFEGRQGALSVALLIVPMVVAAIAMLWLGFYIVAALYMAFFTRVIGKYGPAWVAGSALVVTAGLYVIFELGFRVALPKSIFQSPAFPF